MSQTEGPPEGGVQIDAANLAPRLVARYTRLLHEQADQISRLIVENVELETAYAELRDQHQALVSKYGVSRPSEEQPHG